MSQAEGDQCVRGTTAVVMDWPIPGSRLSRTRCAPRSWRRTLLMASSLTGLTCSCLTWCATTDRCSHAVCVGPMDGRPSRGARDQRCSVACLHSLKSCSIVCQRRRSQSPERISGKRSSKQVSEKEKSQRG